jgi:uncharacterized protein YndB with AHSA1/START domain/DNA-binding transcriptional ArsR family regulator
MIPMEAIFKALSDETRRNLLDRLRERDGQTLTELESRLGMTRFGVMKHLGILEAASLIVTRKQGRFKYHYLNAAPLQEVVDRWIEPLTQMPLARVLLDLKAELEGVKMMEMITQAKPDFMMETFIQTTPEKLWEAITDGGLTKQYHFMSACVEGDFETTGEYRFVTPDGSVMLSGEIVATDRPRFLELTFKPGWGAPNPKTSRHTYEIEQVGKLTKLTILHYDLPADQAGVREGWAKIVASLKSFLETGQGLNFG